MHKRILMYAVFTVIFGMAVGCSSSVKRMPREFQLDLSGRWNDTDSQIIAKTMIKDCLSRDWIPLFAGSKGRKPVVIVGEVVNDSHEHINTGVFIKSLERNLLNSGKIKFVASKNERGQVREEREDQQTNSSAATRKQLAQETGADFMLIGTVSSVKDEIKSRYVIMYQVMLELVDLETNEKVWIGEESIKKVVQKSKYSH